MIKVAFGSVPKDGGTFTFYRNMRPALLQLGIDMRCVSLGRQQAELWEDAYVDEGCVLLAERTRSIKKQALTFSEWCESEAVDIVLGINSEAILSSLPHLPEKIRCMSRCANSFDHGYRITLSGYERLAAIVAQTPRQEKDLTESYNADPGIISVIPNGIEPQTYQAVARNRQNAENPIRIGFLGRLEHNQKGVLFLPEIAGELSRLGVRYQLQIAGKGKHEAALRASFEALGEQTNAQIEFLGALPPAEIPAFLERTDLLLFPSQFEGCPNALLEAMMAGCVPFAWHLPGITDFIISDTVNGFLFGLGDSAALAQSISELATDPDQIKVLSEAASHDTIERFSTEIAAKRYANLFQSVMDRPPPAFTPKDWSLFVVDPNFPHSFKDWIPSPIKRGLKRLVRK